MSSADTQKSYPKACSGRAGFTLIEMMAVMMIIALISSLVVTMIPGTGRAGLKGVVMKSMALLRRERLHAILSGQDQRVALDGRDRRLVGDSGDQVFIPNDVVVDVLGSDEVWPQGRAVAAFYPDGASTGAAVRFSREGVTYEVHVNWYTGGVSVETH
jgi:general secretion pathway protein H